MENKIKKALNNFVEDPSVEENKKKTDKKAVLRERTGLIERVDKVYITNDGRQLLREQY